jgi:predicted glycosyltransferase
VHSVNILRPASSPAVGRQTIWIDLENTPHVPFFRPIIRELETRGYRIVVTAREAFQTCEMATAAGLQYVKVGRHFGQNPLMKVLGLLMRALQLLPFVLRERPVLGLSHGSRAQILLCNILRIPSVLIMDYEHSRNPPMVRPRWEIVPDVIPDSQLHCTDRSRARRYAGIKEDVYVRDFAPDPAILDRLKLRDQVVVTVRPPATEAHYHNPEAEILFAAFMDRACETPGVKVVLLPRNPAQRAHIVRNFSRWFRGDKTVIPDGVIDGLNLLWYSDLAVSGGGTMNREAAALGVPVYSIFRGKLGAVDKALVAQNRLVMVGSRDEIASRIPLAPRSRLGAAIPRNSRALDDILAHLAEILSIEARTAEHA